MRISDEGLISNADAGGMGEAVEHLVAATCILLTRGTLNASTSLVDDEGVDLVFHRRGGASTLAVQVKARMNDSKALAGGIYLQNVRSETLRARDDLYVLFVAVDVTTGTFDTCWLVRSKDLVAKGVRDSMGRYRFAASSKPDSQDKWRAYRMGRRDLPKRVLELLPTM